MFALDELNLYVTLVEAQGITACADRLNMTKSSVSRRLKDLETSLGVKLVERNPRVFKVTQAGREFYAGAQEILQRAEQLQVDVTREQTSPSGRLRIFAPSTLTRWLLEHGLADFSRNYPDIQLEFLSGGHKRSMLEDNIDLMIHINRPKDSSLVAVPLMKVSLDFYASPGYLDAHGHPQKPADLSEHQCIGSLNLDLERTPWRYIDKNKMHALSVNHSHYSDTGAIARSMAEQGLGIVLLPEFVCAESVQQGLLESVFSGKYRSQNELFVMYSGRNLLPSKTRLFLDYLQENHRATI